MKATMPFESESYRAVVAGLLRMHRLALDGQFESDAADALRDEMDEPWAALLPVEVERLTGLSEDLNAIEGSKVAEPALEPNPQSQKNLAAANIARLARDWDRALAILRRWSRYLPAMMCSYMRGSIWREAEEPSIAAAFFEHAWSLNPNDQRFLASFLHVVKDANPVRAHQMAIDVLDRSKQFIRPVVSYAAEILLKQSSEGDNHSDPLVASRIAGILEQNLQVHTDDREMDRAFSEMELTLLAICYVRLGQREKAYAAYTAVIARQPMMAGLYVARADLSVGLREESIADYERAVRLDCEVFRPYLVLADYYLNTSRYVESLEMCARGLKTQLTDKLRSVFLEIRAIAYACLDYPKDEVRDSFRQAIKEYPDNPDARGNLARYEELIADPPSEPATLRNRLTEEHWKSSLDYRPPVEYYLPALSLS